MDAITQSCSLFHPEDALTYHLLALASLFGRNMDLMDKVASAQLGQFARIDLVGLDLRLGDEMGAKGICQLDGIDRGDILKDLIELIPVPTGLKDHVENSRQLIEKVFEPRRGVPVYANLGQTSTLFVYRACDAIVLVIINSDVCVHEGNRLAGS